MTDDELLEYAAKLSRLYLYEQKHKAEDLKGFLARRLKDKMAWQQRQS